MGGASWGAVGVRRWMSVIEGGEGPSEMAAKAEDARWRRDKDVLVLAAWSAAAGRVHGLLSSCSLCEYPDFYCMCLRSDVRNRGCSSCQLQG